MGFTTEKARHFAARVLITCAAGTLPLSVLADDVTLKSADGSINLVGEFIALDGGNYVVRTALGDLRIAANRVQCDGAACPTFDGSNADIQIAGSDTVGLGMMPHLLTGFAAHLNATAAVVPTETKGQVLAKLVGDGGYGGALDSYLVTPTSSGDAFTTLLDGSAQLGMSSRRIRPDEVAALRENGAGDMNSPDQEHIIAVDSLVVITHPSNPISEVSIAQLRDIYAGQITNWSDLGGDDAPITLIGRQDGSGTRSVLEDRLFGDETPSLTDAALVADNNGDMAAMVNDDPHALGFVGYAFQNGAKALSLVNECGITMTPDAFSAKTEEYALQRRLYLYNRDDVADTSVQDFVDYSISPDVDTVIEKAGFIDLGVSRRAQSLDSDRANALRAAEESEAVDLMLGDMVNFDRLSTTFRFETGSTRLDERAQLDMVRLADYLADQPDGTQVRFVGFTDDVGEIDNNQALSVNRADQVMEELAALAGDRVTDLNLDASGFGEIAPTACNINANGRAINRRVEVWIESTEG